jgi:hypothetical protein
MKNINTTRRQFAVLPALAWCHRWAAPLLVAGGLAACATIVGPRQIELSQEKMQQGLERRFPQHQRVLGVFEVELSHPKVAILDQNDRVALTVDVGVTPLLSRQSWHGTLALSGRLVADRARGAIFLNDAHVDRFEFDNMDEGRQRQIAGVANLLSDKAFKDVPIHTFKPEDLRYAGVQFALTRIATRPGALVATVEPAQ